MQHSQSGFQSRISFFAVPPRHALRLRHNHVVVALKAFRMVCTSLLALLLVTDWQLYSALPDASDVSLLPALVISNSEERFERSAAMLRTFGFGAMHSPFT
jgi:hypothetical protein